MKNSKKQLNLGSGFGRVGGFTLIEVVAVLITGLALSVLLPGVTSTVPEQATLDYCLSNLRELGIATLSYASDYEDYLPTEGIAKTGMTGIYPSAWGFKQRIDPYTNSSNPWRCPLDQGYGEGGGSGTSGGERTSYMLNAGKTVYVIVSPAFPGGQWLPYKTTDYPCESKSNLLPPLSITTFASRQGKVFIVTWPG